MRSHISLFITIKFQFLFLEIWNRELKVDWRIKAKSTKSQFQWDSSPPHLPIILNTKTHSVNQTTDHCKQPLIEWSLIPMKEHTLILESTQMEMRLKWVDRYQCLKKPGDWMRLSSHIFKLSPNLNLRGLKTQNRILSTKIRGNFLMHLFKKSNIQKEREKILFDEN